MAISSKGETATCKPPSNIDDGARGFQILILDLQLQVWSLEAQTSTIPLCRNANVGILHRKCKSEHHKPLFEASVNLRASHRLSVCVQIVQSSSEEKGELQQS